MDYVRRSILFEIVNKNTGNKPIEAFTLIIPPESIEISEPQRTSYTKTFGGVFIDDYGEDIIPITISGHTGNSDLKKTFSPPSSQGRVPEKMNGQDSFFHFRNKLMRYKENISNYENYEMIIYDLSLIPERYRKYDYNDLIPSLTEGYVVQLDKFTMKRNKDRPLYFNYTIELTGLRKLGTVRKSYETPIKIENPFNLINSIRRGLNALKSIYGKITAIKNKIENYVELIGQLENQLISFYDQTVDVLLYPSSLARLALASAKSLIETVEDLGESAAEDLGIILKDYYNTITLSQEINRSAAALVTKGKEPDSYENSFVARASSQPTSIEAGIKRYENLTDLESEIFSIVSGVDVSEEEILIAYGHEIVIVTEETSLEALALEYYQNASYQEIIAYYNNIDGVDDLILGKAIKIPILSKYVSVPGNFIYTSYLEDIFGIDILLDDQNNPVVGESGDFLTVSQEKNMVQALNLKLNETLGARLRLVTYGLKEMVGFANSTPIPYIISNINDTIIQDPRIENLDNIAIKGDGDSLSISFNCYTIKKGEMVPFSGNI